MFDYDTAWLDTALERAARAAEVEDFPFVADIRSGVVRYLESRCPLKLMPIADLYDRMRRMLVKIEAGAGFEIGFFESLRGELTRLRAAGVEEIRFAGLRECVMALRGVNAWDKGCARLQHEIEMFLNGWKNAERNTPCAVAE